jgi:anti-sigma factor RsiW
MDEHAFVRDRLTLAAAGALDAADQRRVEQHLRECAGCRAEFAAWSRLTADLEAMPTPQAPLGLVERTRLQIERNAALAGEQRQQRWLFFWLTVFAWATTVLSWPLFGFLGSRAGRFVDLSWTHVSAGEAWIGYMFVVGTIGALAVGLLGSRRMQEERTT